MFSDFSLKSLIGSWSEEHLGPKPFVKIGEISSGFNLKFDCNTLKECDSAQLNKVGELCEKGECHVHALGGTILYTVDSEKLKHNKYKLEVLTVVDDTSSGKPLESFIKNQKNYVC